MADTFSNSYEDETRADAYAQLEFPGTYYLAYRDLPAIIGKHVPPLPVRSSPTSTLAGGGVKGSAALDFGCGTGRSTRFLRRLGFDVVGADISEQMLAKAREFDPDGDYRLVTDDGLGALPSAAFDLVLSVFTFDNIPDRDRRVALFRSLKRLLKPGGFLILLDSTPEIYLHEWASFSTKDFPSNRTAKSGDQVYTRMLDVEDRRPVTDVLWTHEDYFEQFGQAGLSVVEIHRPLGRADEPIAWVSETTIAPWVIYVLRPL